MREEIVPKRTCDLVYVRTPDGGSHLSRCNLHKDYHLFKVDASYAPNLVLSPYYVIASNKKEAKAAFLNRFPWLRYIKSTTVCEGEEADFVLKFPARHIIVG